MKRLAANAGALVAIAGTLFFASDASAQPSPFPPDPIEMVETIAPGDFIELGNNNWS